ncbi:hypothetical protein LQK93_01069 [Terrabacter sp. BE26]
MQTPSNLGWAGRHIVPAFGAILLVGTFAACGATSGVAGPGTTSASVSTVRADVPADARTRQIAQVEVERQCAVGTKSFAKEADIDADLAKRLEAAGLSHQEWKSWHDSLVVSPALVDQLAAVSKTGCPKA